MCWCRPEIRTPKCDRLECVPPGHLITYVPPVAPAFAPIPGTLVIGIGHKARHGKDTAASLLVREFGAERFGFADDLYAVCRAVYKMIGKDAPLLQAVGTEVMRQGRAVTLPDGRALRPFGPADPDVWIRSVYSKILASRPALAVIADVRFPNELGLVKAMGGEVWKVERRLRDRSLFVDPSRPADHPSEIALDGATWDRVIANPDGNPALFEDRIRRAYYTAAQRRRLAA